MNHIVLYINLIICCYYIYCINIIHAHMKWVLCLPEVPDFAEHCTDPILRRQPYGDLSPQALGVNSWVSWGGYPLVNIQNWLVVWNMNFIFTYIGNNNPNWLLFFRVVETINQPELWKITFFEVSQRTQWHCSTAMLVYQRVYHRLMTSTLRSGTWMN